MHKKIFFIILKRIIQYIVVEYESILCVCEWRPLEMGCYGIGVTRLLAAAVEVSTPLADAPGHEFLRWPLAIAPHLVALIVPKVSSLLLFRFVVAFHIVRFRVGNIDIRISILPKLFLVFFSIPKYRNSSQANFSIIPKYRNSREANFGFIQKYRNSMNENFSIIPKYRNSS